MAVSVIEAYETTDKKKRAGRKSVFKFIVFFSCDLNRLSFLPTLAL